MKITRYECEPSTDSLYSKTFCPRKTGRWCLYSDVLEWLLERGENESHTTTIRRIAEAFCREARRNPGEFALSVINTLKRLAYDNKPKKVESALLALLDGKEGEEGK